MTMRPGSQSDTLHSGAFAKEPSHPTDSRHTNARELFLLLRANSPRSRADLARLSGLSEPTVSRPVNYLVSHRLVSSLGVEESGGGRRPNLLSLNPQCAYVAGIDITYSSIALVLADLEGTQIGKWSSDVGSLKTPERVVKSAHGLRTTPCRGCGPKCVVADPPNTSVMFESVTEYGTSFPPVTQT
jgi:DNA-binding transcriptional ArsR family regulator